MGYIKLNEAPAQTDIRDADSLELERIYVSENAQGVGLGSYMMERALETAQRKGKKYIWLGVWEKNTKAVSFYRKHGFYEIGAHPFLLGDDVQTDILMWRDLRQSDGSPSCSQIKSKKQSASAPCFLFCLVHVLRVRRHRLSAIRERRTANGERRTANGERRP